MTRGKATQFLNGLSQYWQPQLFRRGRRRFGKCSELRDSHDRYANIKISYLLQNMEDYNGVAILATNPCQNLDEAFVRRLAFVELNGDPGARPAFR